MAAPHVPDQETIDTPQLDEKFINPSESILEWFSEEALEEADRDFAGLFLSMFTRARRIAVDESGDEVNFQIDRAAWQRGKWAVLQDSKRTGRHGIWHVVLRWINRGLPLFIGFLVDPDVLKNPSNLQPGNVLIIALLGVVYWATCFLEERWEDEKWSV
jgi:hypothetical protein